MIYIYISVSHRWLNWHRNGFARYCKYIWHKITCKPERCLKGWKVWVFSWRHGPRNSTTLRPLQSGSRNKADLSWPRPNLSCWKSWKKPYLAHSNWEEKRCTKRIREKAQLTIHLAKPSSNCFDFDVLRHGKSEAPSELVRRHSWPFILPNLVTEWKTNLALAWSSFEASSVQLHPLQDKASVRLSLHIGQRDFPKTNHFLTHFRWKWWPQGKLAISASSRSSWQMGHNWSGSTSLCETDFRSPSTTLPFRCNATDELNTAFCCGVSSVLISKSILVFLPNSANIFWGSVRPLASKITFAISMRSFGCWLFHCLTTSDFPVSTTTSPGTPG